jgi:hypothetical protein
MPENPAPMMMASKSVLALVIGELPSALVMIYLLF